MPQTKPLPCACLLLHLRPADVAMFRFLLETYENMAMFTVLDRKAALLKIFFAPESKDQVCRILQEIAKSIPLSISDWPD